MQRKIDIVNKLKEIRRIIYNIPFYVKQSFDKYEKTIKNYFIDMAKGEIKDGELVCTDLIYYSKD